MLNVHNASVKFFDEENGAVNGYEWNDSTKNKFAKTMEKNFSTDYLFDRGIEFIEQQRNNNKPFALMLSIPGESN